MERRAATVAKRLLQVLKENWTESWFQDLIRNDGKRVPIELLPEVLEEMALLQRRRFTR